MRPFKTRGPSSEMMLVSSADVMRFRDRGTSTPPPEDPRPSPDVAEALELALEYDDGTSIAGATYEVALGDGTKRTGAFDEQEQATLDDVPPGPCSVELGELSSAV